MSLDETLLTPGGWERFSSIDFLAASERLRGVTRRTPLLELPSPDPRLRLFAKAEHLQETGSFKARGAWNQVAQLTAEERARGVVTTSSGNHGRALAWAAARAGVAATIVMPQDAYPNKIRACRELGAEVVLGPTRAAAEALCAERAAAGAVLIHPYDSERTVEGAGTVGLEIAADAPDVEVVVFPVGGGGLVSGGSLALRRALGRVVRLVGVEPRGAPSLSLGLAAGEPVTLESITTGIGGLCPLHSGRLNIEITHTTLDRVELLGDETILAAQARLVRELDQIVEPAGAAATAWVWNGGVPEEWYAGRSRQDPLRVVTVISGGNPDPAQLERLRAEP